MNSLQMLHFDSSSQRCLGKARAGVGATLPPFGRQRLLEAGTPKVMISNRGWPRQSVSFFFFGQGQQKDPVKSREEIVWDVG